ncbi:MAG: SagB/ThcOx family dehydrogenase [Bryobacteraceae bacterium]|jgi:nitroreductase
MSRSFFALLLVPAGLLAQELKPVALPAPQITGGKPLMQALKERKSTRDFSQEKLSPQVLSNLLWAGWGINREDGHRTAPSASNRQEIEIYAVTADGASVYDAKGNALKPVASGDLRKLTGSQPFVGEAPLNLVYVADFAKMGGADESAKTAMSNANTGFIAQNVYLYCASEGLGAVVRASVSRPELSKALNLRPEQRITLVQTVGYIKK